MANRMVQYAFVSLVVSIAGASSAVAAPTRAEPAISPLLFPLVSFDMQVKRAQRPITIAAMREAQSRPCPGPEYPAGAKARGEQGVTRIGFTVDGDGWVSSAKVVKSSGYAVLDEAALSTIGGCWFQPPADRSVMYAEQDYNWKLEIEKATAPAGSPQ